MNKQRSLASYRRIDLTFFSVIVFLFEFVIIRLSKGLFRQEFWAVSLTCPLACIVYMRWGSWGMLIAAAGGAAWCLGNGTGGKSLPGLCFYLIYILGNLLSAAAIPIMNKLGKDRIRKTTGLTLGITLLTQLFMHLGRMLIALLCGTGIAELIDYITTDSLSYVFSCVVVFAASKADGVYEDQITYLKRIHKEEALKEVAL